MARSKRRTVTINATLNVFDASGEKEVELLAADRGADLVVDAGTSMPKILSILFDGFDDRLRAAGIKVHDMTNFT